MKRVRLKICKMCERKFKPSDMANARICTGCYNLIHGAVVRTVKQVEYESKLQQQGKE